ncbi:unnamed protein product [Calypogeia fissa]
MAGLAESAVLSSSLAGLSSSVEILKGGKQSDGKKINLRFGGRKNSSDRSDRDDSCLNLRIVAAGESSGNGDRKMSSFVGNGAAAASGRKSNGSGYNMVPIEEAVKRAGTGSSYVSSNVMTNGSANRIAGRKSTTFDSVSLDGAIKGAPNGVSGQNGSSTRTSTVNGNGRSASNGRATSNGSTLIRQGNPGETKVNGAAIANGASIMKIVVRAPVQLPVIEEGLRVLPSDEGFSWSRSNYNRLQRTIDVWSFVLALRARVFFLDTKWTYPGGFTEEKKKARTRKTAAWVRETILQLGPTFIKLGQLSSTRSDLFPAEFVEELAKLQDRVPAFSAEKAIALIEKELGAPINEIFAQFERQPIAAASLGQVHRAVLFNGEKVAVKLQRPGLKELFDIDLDNMKQIAEYFQSSESLGGPTRDWVGIYEECSTILYQEIDYINEGRNADRFRRDFRNYKWARVPQIYWDYVSRKVLTLEYVPGIKVNDLAVLDKGGFDRAKIAKYAIEAYLIQILKTGFFHADPHPGNLAVDTDGSLIYYDFGMMGEIKAFTREKLLEMFYAVYEKDAQKVINALIDLGALVPTGDLTSVRKTVQFFLDNLMNQRPDQASTFSAIGEDLFAIAVDQPFRFPATFTFVLRAFSTLEGIGTILDPDFSFAKIAAPYAQELLDVRDRRNDGRFIVLELQKQATDARDAAVAMPLRIQRMDEIITKLEAGDVKLRVRVLEAERAARRASIQQSATLNVVAAACLINIGVQLTIAEGLSPLTASPFAAAGVFLLLVLNSFRRIKNLDKFEKML